MKKNILLILLLVTHILISQNNQESGRKKISDQKYNSQDIEFINDEDHIKLYGTLLSPDTKYSKIAIIVPGSGKNTRDSHYFLAQELLKEGIAVFRYDERGVGMSEGKYKFIEDNDDLYYAIKKLKESSIVSNIKIGVIGHSMGGFLVLSAYEKNNNLDFLVLLSTPIEKDGKFRKRYFIHNDQKTVSLQNVLTNIKTPTLFMIGTEDSFCNPEKAVTLLSTLENPKITINKEKEMNHFLIKGNDSWRKTESYDLLYEMDQKTLSEIVNWLNTM
ncbi:alpha/beta hydrolase [Flavobacterium pectinovorum]|uniref:Alpha/beta fold hydrolase n=1 Tax=Flavobacterium pectinovorum TaxID=29533 RepID=A0A502ET77_9FLAO|nr:alpha/beta fold hydrolase [Flavobacterium pectinovorum]TPG40747.1 alpha/beta fold hydrolase [Flavobacterium pectinovorum]